MGFSGLLFLLFLLIPSAISQAPGDEDRVRCVESSTYGHPYPDNVKVLMDSWNYEQLLPGHGDQPIPGAVWTDVSLDNNDDAQFPFITPPYWQHGAGGICRWQAQVCGYTVGDQNNWLFTQHISKDVDDERNNYPVDVVVEITYNFQSCRERNQCHRQLKVHHYITNSPTSTSNYQTTSRHTEIGTVSSTGVDSVSTEVLTFQLQPGETGFYLAIQDFQEGNNRGTCVGISRILVYRNNCRKYQTGLVLYPDTPAPQSGSEAVNIMCANNASVIGSAEVTCQSSGLWGPESPECGCNPGYEYDRANEECDICPAGNYQAFLSNTEQCQPCPGQSSSDQPGTAVCPCDCELIRHPQRPGDRCTVPPSSPQFYAPVPKEPAIIISWLSSEEEGESGDLYYDVYASQLNSSDAEYRRVNSEGITNTCDGGSGCSYNVPGINPKIPYSLLVVAANNATGDPSTFSNVTLLGGRFLAFVVGSNTKTETCAGLGVPVGVTFILTLVFTAVFTALITLAIVYFVLRRSNSSSSSTSHTHTSSAGAATYKTGSGNDSVDIKTHDIYNPTNPEFSEDLGHPPYTVKPVTPSRPAPPSRPATAPPRPPVTTSSKPAMASRPAPPSRPPYSPPKPQRGPQHRPQNGF